MARSAHEAVQAKAGMPMGTTIHDGSVMAVTTTTTAEATAMISALYCPIISARSAAFARGLIYNGAHEGEQSAQRGDDRREPPPDLQPA